jgi:hypothetical protein
VDVVLAIRNMLTLLGFVPGESLPGYMRAVPYATIVAAGAFGYFVFAPSVLLTSSSQFRLAFLIPFALMLFSGALLVALTAFVVEVTDADGNKRVIVGGLYRTPAAKKAIESGTTTDAKLLQESSYDPNAIWLPQSRAALFSVSTLSLGLFAFALLTSIRLAAGSPSQLGQALDEWLEAAKMHRDIVDEHQQNSLPTDAQAALLRFEAAWEDSGNIERDSMDVSRLREGFVLLIKFLQNDEGIVQVSDLADSRQWSKVACDYFVSRRPNERESIAELYCERLRVYQLLLETSRGAPDRDQYLREARDIRDEVVSYEDVEGYAAELKYLLSVILLEISIPESGDESAINEWNTYTLEEALSKATAACEADTENFSYLLNYTRIIAVCSRVQGVGRDCERISELRVGYTDTCSVYPTKTCGSLASFTRAFNVGVAGLECLVQEWQASDVCEDLSPSDFITELDNVFHYLSKAAAWIPDEPNSDDYIGSFAYSVFHHIAQVHAFEYGVLSSLDRPDDAAYEYDLMIKALMETNKSAPVSERQTLLDFFDTQFPWQFLNDQEISEARAIMGAS